MIRLSVAFYLLSVASKYAVVEILRRGPGATIASGFIELLALSILLSVAIEMGVPSRVQWSLLASRTQGSASRPATLLQSLGWCLALARRDFSRQAAAVSVGLGGALIVAAWLGAGGQASHSLGVVIALAVFASARTLGCVLLEGNGDFAGSRFFQSVPIVLLTLHVLLAALGVLPATDSAAAVIAWFVAYHVLAVIALFARLATMQLHLPDLDAVAAQSPTTSVRWHIFAAATALQQQVFYVVAPIFGLSAFTVFFYYGQKTSQVLTEVLQQVVKERVAHQHWRITDHLLPRVLMMALAPAVAAVLAMAFAQPLHGAFLVAAALFFLNEYVLASSSVLAQIAMYHGAMLPVAVQLLNNAVQVAAAVVLAGIVGVAGYPLALLVTGAVLAYRYNFMLYLYRRAEACRAPVGGIVPTSTGG